MFDRLSEKLGGIAGRLRGAARVSEADLDATLREMRLALLEADVALPVARHLMSESRERALGAEVSNKLARMLAAQGKKVVLTSVDATRPAARTQLKVLAGQVDVPYIEGDGDAPVAMAKSALNMAKTGGHHVLILDTAGRQVVDDALMAEIREVAAAVRASERLLVLDSMTGQTALTIAEQFHASVELSGCILTKTDADVRGGAALSVAHVTGVPVRYVGTGEKTDAFELFANAENGGYVRHVEDATGRKTATGRAGTDG